MEAFMNNSWYLYDLLLLAIVGLCLINGWRSGIMSTIISLISYGIAILLASLLSTPISGYVYEYVAKPACSAVIANKLEYCDVQDTVNSALAQYGVTVDSDLVDEISENPEDAADTLYDYASEQTGCSREYLESIVSDNLEGVTDEAYGALPAWMQDSVSETMDDMNLTDTDKAAQMAALLMTEDYDETADTLTDTYLQPVIQNIIKYFIFSILFFLISFVFRVIIERMRHLWDKEYLIQGNQILGMIIGGAKAVLFCIFAVKFTGWIVESGMDALPFFNTDTIEKTIIFHIFYGI